MCLSVCVCLSDDTNIWVLFVMSKNERLRHHSQTTDLVHVDDITLIDHSTQKSNLLVALHKFDHFFFGCLTSSQGVFFLIEVDYVALCVKSSEMWRNLHASLGGLKTCMQNCGNDWWLRTHLAVDLVNVAQHSHVRLPHRLVLGSRNDHNDARAWRNGIKISWHNSLTHWHDARVCR